MFCHQCEQLNPFSVSPETVIHGLVVLYFHRLKVFSAFSNMTAKSKRNVVVREAVLKGHRSPPVTAKF